MHRGKLLLYSCFKTAMLSSSAVGAINELRQTEILIEKVSFPSTWPRFSFP